MKKIILSIFLCSFVGAVFAQGVKFGVTAGLDVSKETTKYLIATVNTDWKAGFQAGVFMDYALSSNLSLIPELLFTQKGGKHSVEEETAKISYSRTLNYLQLPVNLAYKFDIGNEQKLFPFAGIYLAYALSGTDKNKGGGASSNEKVKFGSGAEELKAFDYGLNLGVGYQYTKILFKLQYNFGLANLSNLANTTNRNSNLAVTVGYLF